MLLIGCPRIHQSSFISFSTDILRVVLAPFPFFITGDVYIVTVLNNTGGAGSESVPAYY